MQFMIFFIVLFLGGLIQGAIGFGLAIFCMSVLPFFIPFKIAVVAVLCSSIFMIIRISIQLYSKINFQMALYPILAFVIGGVFGVWCLTYFNERLMIQILAVVLILLSVYFAFFSHRIEIKANTCNGIVAGLLSGIFGGMANISGPPLVAYYFSASLDKEEYMATTQATFAIGGIVSIITNLYYGNITQEVLEYAATGVVGALIGSKAGLYIFKKMNHDMLSKIIYLFMLMMGLMLFFKSL